MGGGALVGGDWNGGAPHGKRQVYVFLAYCQRMSDYGIFHGIDTDDHRKNRANTGFSGLLLIERE